MSVDEKVEGSIWKHALINAYRHGGRANDKAVLGKLLSERPDLRPRVKDLLGIVEGICDRVSSMSLDEQRRTLEELAPEVLSTRRVGAAVEGLPPLPNARKGHVVTRFAPNPDSVLHLGSARAAILSHDYVKIYGGKFILRFDDTDPRTKRPRLELYDAIRDDLMWLGCPWDEEHVQSSRLPVYYGYAEKLIEMGKAYVCTCPPGEFRRHVLASRPCPCRNLTPEENMERWRRMLDGGYGEGEAVLRIKTDLNHPNPAVREWPASRVIDTERNPHPLVGSKYRVWPLYNWASAIDDKLMGITHIFRGQEHSTNTVKQRFVYAYLGWEYPTTIHYGRLNVEGGVLSKSRIEEGMRSGFYRGYDDPRLATLRALRRRGIMPEVIRNMMYSVGVKGSDATVSWENLLSMNRKIVDPIAHRYFAVMDPMRLLISGLKSPLEARMARHPQDPGAGYRIYTLEPEDDRLELLVDRGDVKEVGEGGMVRLMGLSNVKLERFSTDLVEANAIGGGVEEARSAHIPLIQWVSPVHSVKIRVMMDDASEREGLAERLVSQEDVGSIVQFERLFFARLDSKLADFLLFYYTSR